MCVYWVRVPQVSANDWYWYVLIQKYTRCTCLIWCGVRVRLSEVR
jgi:hypothetical protein